MVAWWILLIVGIACLAIGFVVGALIIKHYFEKQLEEHPPINKDMIRAMYAQMGRKPSEKDINRVIAEMNKYKS